MTIYWSSGESARASGESVSNNINATKLFIMASYSQNCPAGNHYSRQAWTPNPVPSLHARNPSDWSLVIKFSLVLVYQDELNGESAQSTAKLCQRLVGS